MSGRVLIVDGIAGNRITLRAALAAAGYDAAAAADAETALRVARRAMPDLILTDLALPDMPGPDLIARLRAEGGAQDMPLVALAPPGAQPPRIAALRAGADDVLPRGMEPTALLARLRNLLRPRALLADLRPGGAGGPLPGLAEGSAGFPEPPGTIALVADRPETALRWRRSLATLLRDRLVVMSRAEALAEPPVAAGPDLWLIEAQANDPGGGLRVLSELRARSAARHTGVCLMRDGAWTDAATAYDLDAGDLVTADIDPEELALRLSGLMRRKRLADRHRATLRDGLRHGTFDPLTGLHNRYFGLKLMDEIAAAARRTDAAGYAVMMVDLDRFKMVNDRWGHAAGDAVLAEVARRLSANLRAGDLVARMGGEEFLVALPATGLPDARRVAERLREAVRETPFTLPGGETLRVTASIGLALAEGGGAEPAQSVIDRADKALLTAKTAGRNRVTLGLTAA